MHSTATTAMRTALAALLLAGSLALAGHDAPARAAVAHDDTTPACTPPTTTLGSLEFGRVTPGTPGSANGSLIVPAGGTVTATITDGSPVFRVGGMESYHIKRERVAIDLSEMPPGYHGPRFYFQTVCTLDAQTSGSGPLVVQPGDMVTVYATGNPATVMDAATGTMAVTVNQQTTLVSLHMLGGGIWASLDSGAASMNRGSEGAIDVSLLLLGGPAIQARFDLSPPVPGITVTNPLLWAPTDLVHTSLYLRISPDAPLGPHTLHVTVHAYENLPASDQQSFALGSVTVTVWP